VVSRTAPPLVPAPLAVSVALERTPVLVRLIEQVQDSRRRLSAIRSLLPSGLENHLHAGPVDEHGWTVFAANAAVAAKLRQCRPALEQALAAQGWQVSAIRIKVQSS